LIPPQIPFPSDDRLQGIISGSCKSTLFYPSGNSYEISGSPKEGHGKIENNEEIDRGKNTEEFFKERFFKKGKESFPAVKRVGLFKVEKDSYASFAQGIQALGNHFVSRGDRVLIKPNLVQPRPPGSGEVTNVAVIEAVARYCLDAGASRVVIGEGPTYYQSESRLRDCFTETGVAAMAGRLGIDWVLFDEHRYRTFRGVPGVTPKEFRVTEFAFDCDQFINVPVLKTHFITAITLSMKNLKGCLKREDKPRFHDGDLNRAVVELNRIIRPTLNVIDCTHHRVKESGGAKGIKDGQYSDGGWMIAGKDIVATDAVGSALMGLDPEQIPMIRLAAAAGLGESSLSRIEILGENLKAVQFRVKLPREQLRQSFPTLEILGAEKACSGCLIPVLSSLSTLEERGLRPGRPLTLCLGRDGAIPDSGSCLRIGDCARTGDGGESTGVGGCPPRREEILSRLLHWGEEGAGKPKGKSK
jgi:uncharacterized protein (DUF362 family)